MALAPNAVNPNALLGDILAALERPQEARQCYARALTLAKTIEPDFQVGWVEHLQKKLGGSEDLESHIRALYAKRSCLA